MIIGYCGLVVWRDKMENFKIKLRNEIGAYAQKILQNNWAISQLNTANVELAEEIQMREQHLKFYEINEKGKTLIVEGYQELN